MPELTELDKATASMTEKRKEETASSDSDSDDTIPELEDAGKIYFYLVTVINGKEAACSHFCVSSRIMYSRNW